jgi:hypothetical protein
MHYVWRHRPSPAMVVAFIALCVALAGSASALPGRNKVKKGDIARSAVTSRTIAKGAVRTRAIRSRNVTRSRIALKAIDSSRVGSDALTGANILESSLGTVPSATAASNVNGLSLEKFFYREAHLPSMTRVLNFGGLVLDAACNFGILNVHARTNVSGATIHAGGTWSRVQGAEQDFYSEDDDFNVGETLNPLDDLTATTTANSNLQGSLTYTRQDGGVITATFLAEQSSSLCLLAGTAVGQ